MSIVSWLWAFFVFLHSSTQADRAGRGQGEFWRALHKQWNVLAQEGHVSLLFTVIGQTSHTGVSVRGTRKYSKNSPSMCLKAREARTSGVWAVMVPAISQERRRGQRMSWDTVTLEWGGEREPAQRLRRNMRRTWIPGSQVMLLPLEFRIFTAQNDWQRWAKSTSPTARDKGEGRLGVPLRTRCSWCLTLHQIRTPGQLWA